jgi:pimeloyl-ACP methyl ester carboxylesterase
MGIRSFQIHVEQPVLDDLRARLERTRWTEVMSGSGWASGTSARYLRELVSYWRDGYDWRLQESKLNALPQFKAAVDVPGAGPHGVDLHFIHVKGRGPRPTPLLLLHGWPDSFHRFHKVIPIFSDPAGGGAEAGGEASDSFDVVVPSLPGFAFTGPVRWAGQAQVARRSAEALWRLMTGVLGYQRFAVAGGDGGSVIAQILAIDHPEAVLGIHLTDLGWHALKVEPSTASKAEQKYLQTAQKQAMSDGAYALVQMTQPRTLAAGLHDSPVGLASWIVDRFHSWFDSDIELGKGITPDELLTNIMLYWVTRTIGSSMFNYHAEARSPSLTTADRVNLPVGLALFPKEPGGIPPRGFAERTLNVQRWTEMPRGGHFAALEEPRLFSGDVIEFFRPLRAVHPRPDPARRSHVASSL